jgi:hypothetical protein
MADVVQLDLVGKFRLQQAAELFDVFHLGDAARPADGHRIAQQTTRKVWPAWSLAIALGMQPGVVWVTACAAVSSMGKRSSVVSAWPDRG